eukprot:CAMPEP_0172041194 /NCGR_PEP_ID=MMETSP1041-20130122/24918_1 /TAXON_ID=464988 /ORGANISM="Hemiselmis andersenii, Strain CCMP439" /LENGTH=37 /DNA_ID= /DNA_START= /DNA_END= /DNA_ORIENTATION=
MTMQHMRGMPYVLSFFTGRRSGWAAIRGAASTPPGSG